MTRLRKMILEELQRRNCSESTAHSFIRAVEDFARYFNRPPDQLPPEQIREYQAHLFRDRKLAANTVIQRLGALRFFFAPANSTTQACGAPSLRLSIELRT